MATVTCHTAGCGNAGIAIPDVPLYATDPDTHERSRVAAVVCGVCAVEITDIDGTE